MRFAFTDEQRMLEGSVRDLLARECTAAHVRRSWESGAGVPGLWGRLVELGVVGMTAPEAAGGLGLGMVDLVLLLEASGKAALPDPLVETTAVAIPLLAELGGGEWLDRISAGTARIAVGLETPIPMPHLLDGAAADVLLLERGGALHAVPRAAVTLTPVRSVDHGRRLSRIESWKPSAETRLADGATAATAAAFDRGALGTSAQLLGLADHLITTTVEYAKIRHQFGRPIGSFQAVKHALADAKIALEFARPLVYRAAASLTALHVSMAKAQASEAALLAARVALQAHGAIGYSFEFDLHLWMKRTWALAAAWGDAPWHRARVGAAILDGLNDAATEVP